MYYIGSFLIALTNYIMILVFSYLLRNFLKIYYRNKTLKFTQKEVKEKQQKIDNITNELNSMEENCRKPRDVSKNYINTIVKVLYLYNELAVGIKEGLYDELYIKMILGFDMIDFYKRYYNLVASVPRTEKKISRFMPLELLLKKWDTDELPLK